MLKIMHMIIIEIEIGIVLKGIFNSAKGFYPWMCYLNRELYLQNNINNINHNNNDINNIE